MQNLHRTRANRRAGGAAAAAVLGAALSLPATGQSELHVAIHADLKNIDPIWTTALITSNHGYAIYDTLFGTDADFQPQPQMAEGYTLSDDGRVYTITLRRRARVARRKPGHRPGLRRIHQPVGETRRLRGRC